MGAVGKFRVVQVVVIPLINVWKDFKSIWYSLSLFHSTDFWQTLTALSLKAIIVSLAYCELISISILLRVFLMSVAEQSYLPRCSDLFLLIHGQKQDQVYISFQDIRIPSIHRYFTNTLCSRLHTAISNNTAETD